MKEFLRIDVGGFDSLGLENFHSLVAGMLDGLVLWTQGGSSIPLCRRLPSEQSVGGVLQTTRHSRGWYSG